jgi:hypothetical protein
MINIQICLAGSRLLNQADTISCTGSVYSTTLRGKPSYAATHPPRQLSQDTRSSTTQKVWTIFLPQPESQGNIHIYDTQVRIKGDPIEPSRPEHYYKEKKMKYRKKKSSRTKYKQKEIQGKKLIACTLTPYKEEHGGSSSRWECEKSPTMDGGQRNWRGEDRQKL